MKPPSVQVVLPCLNEAAALPGVISKLPAGYGAIVVDNGSDDASAAVAIQLGAQVIAEPRRGFGAAVHAGLKAATADIIVIMDADGSFDSGQTAELVDLVARGEVDLVLGRRLVTQRGAWPPHARVANFLLARRLTRLTGYNLHDLGPMRAARRAALLNLDLRDRRSGYPLEMLLKAAATNWRVREVPVRYLPRVGKSKVTGTVRGTLTAVSDMRKQLRLFKQAP